MSEQMEREVRIINEAAEAISSALPRAELALVLGSGLGAFGERLTDAQSLAYTDIPFFPAPSIPGHSGRLIYGHIGSRGIYAFCGRFHYYEGHEPQTVILPVRVLHKLGCDKLILTNAAGGVNPAFMPGDLMLIRDHINLTGYNPLRGENAAEWGPRFPDMTRIYAPELRQLAKEVAAELGVSLQEGIYCGLSGPTFETPSEIRMLGLLGADAVGMSTVPEAIAAAQAGMSVLAISCITNLAAGISKQPLSHEEVMKTGRLVEEKFTSLIENIIQRM
jgi:purine-nucleoside phosphorylase